MEINEKLIKQVAKNANLNLSDSEIKSFEQDFKEILNNFEKLSKAEVSEIPSFHPVELKNKIREDIVEKSITNKQALQNVDETNDEYIRGPKVV